MSRLELVHEFTFRAELKPPVAVGSGPFGDRAIFEATGGEVTGERIRGTVGTGGGDWILTGPDGVGRLDVRVTLHTADGAHLYVQYFGILVFNEAVMAALGGERSTDYDEQYFRTAPRIETGDERYAWVNRAVFIGEGRLHPGPAVEYRVHRVT
jgi:hypothetical protein